MLLKLKRWTSEHGVTALGWLGFVWLVYGYSLFFDFFIFDDHLHFYENKYVGVSSWSDLLYFWKNSLTPVIFFVWQLIALLFGNESPYPFRVFNFFLLAGIAFLLFDALKSHLDRLKIKAHWMIPYLATVVYLIHPAQVESVIWVSSGRTLLATLLALLSYKFYFKKNHFLMVVFFTLAILSKPSVVMLPVFICGIEYLSGKSLKDSLLALWPLFLMSAILGVLHSLDVLTPHLKKMSLETRSLVFLDSVSHYLKMVFLPYEPLFNYGRNPLRVLLDYQASKVQFVFIPIILLLFLVAGLFTKHLKKLSFFVILFFLLLMPNMGLFQYDFQNISTVSNRYLNFPLLALCFGLLHLLVYLNEKLSEKKGVLGTLGGAVLLFLLYSNMTTGFEWQSNERVLEKGEGVANYSNAVSLARYQLERGQFKKAEASFYAALESDPTAFEPILGLIDVYVKYQYRGNIEKFLNRIEKEKIVIPMNYALKTAGLYFFIEDYKQTISYCNSAFQSGLKLSDVRSLYERAERALQKKKHQAYLNLIKILFDEGQSQKAYSLRDEAALELGETPELRKIKEGRK